MTLNTASGTTQKRAYALDALRGFAILAMVLSGTIAYGILPAWMYHAQEPPPTHTYNPNLPGLTWVDTVFPLFLFSMGAAIPLAMSRRIDKGSSHIKILLSILKRGFFLGTFAIVLQHLRPQVINPNEAEAQKWWIALLGFLIISFMFVRLPNSWQPWLRRAVTLIAWSAAIVLLAYIRYPDAGKPGFSLYRSDIILIVLTNTAVFGSIAWLFTRSNLLLRLGCLGILLALRLSSTGNGWVDWLWSATPTIGKYKFDWIFRVEYLQYLFVVIPGSIIGDIILKWMQNRLDNDRLEGESNFETDSHLPQSLLVNQLPTWDNSRFYIITFLMCVINFVLLYGLQSRLVWQTTLISTILCAAAWFLFSKPTTPTEKLLNNFYSWGLYWLAIGLIFEPYEKGIKKDPATMSYYFVTTGMAIFLLIALTIIIDIFNQKKWLCLLIDNGQNPMIAYVAFANFLWPILVLTGIDNLIIENSKTPFAGFLKGFGYTLFVACFVSLFTRLKIFWRT